VPISNLLSFVKKLRYRGWLSLRLVIKDILHASTFILADIFKHVASTIERESMHVRHCAAITYTRYHGRKDKTRAIRAQATTNLQHRSFTSKVRIFLLHHTFTNTHSILPLQKQPTSPHVLHANLEAVMVCMLTPGLQDSTK
jgi:hypothetical protein